MEEQKKKKKKKKIFGTCIFHCCLRGEGLYSFLSLNNDVLSCF